MEPKLVVILFFVVLAVMLQAAAMLGILLALLKMRREVEGLRADVRQRLDPLAQAVGTILADSREPIRTITTNLAEVSRVLRDRAGQVDRVVEELVERSRLQMIRVDQMATDLVTKVESTVDAVQRQVMKPIQEASAVLQGVRSTLQFLFSRRRSPRPGETTQDEQMFI
jgi:ABC-type transporter Mla subunit MlaD